jgi:DNA polymerase III subunit alpha, Gram-positive type
MNKLFVIDFETTGLNIFHNNVIEVGIKLIGSNDHYTSLVMPRSENLNIPQRVVEITGITRDMVLNDGHSEHSVVENIFNYISSYRENNETIYLIAHNGYSFDFVFLKRLVKGYNDNVNDNQKISLENFRFIDSMYLAKLLLVNERVNQPGLCQRYNIQNSQEHRAMGDVLSLEELYIELCQQYSYRKGYNNNHYLENPEEILKETYYY